MDNEHLEWTVMLESKLSPSTRAELEAFLWEYKDVFTWSHEDMLGIDLAMMCHHLCVNQRYKPVIQKRRAFNPEKYEASNMEVKKLLATGFIREMTNLE